MRPIKIGSAALVMAAVVAAAAPARADVAVQASADRTTVGSDDSFAVTVTVGGAQNAELAAPPMRDFQIVSRSSATEMSITNGGTPETSERIVLGVRPLHTGKLTFPSLTVRAGGQTAHSNPLSIEVVPGHVAAPPQRASNDPFAGFGFGSDPFGEDDDLADLMRRMQSNMVAPRPGKNDVLVRATVDNSHPYVGEQTTLSIHLLTRVPLSSVQLTRLPSVSGVTADDLPAPKEPEPQLVSVGGKQYQSVLLARKALFPLRAGAVDVPTIEVAADSGGAFGGGYRISLSSAPLRFVARALPPGGAADEAVGRWTLSASASPARPVAGEPLTIAVTVDGSGDLHALSPPAPIVPAGWHSYAPSTHDIPRVVRAQVGGTRVVETVVVPDRAGRFVVEVPPLAYFDPARHRHVEARTAPLVVDVAPAPAVTASAVGPAAPTAARSPTVAAHARWKARAFELLVAALMLLGAAALLVRAAWRRRRRAPTTARMHLRRAHRHLQQAAALRARERTVQVYDELARALRHAVAAAAPADARSPARLDQHLDAAGLPADTRAALMAAADAVDAGRFAPFAGDAQEAWSLVAAAIAAVERTPRQGATARSALA